MIVYGETIPDRWRAILCLIVLVVFILGVLFKRLSDDLHEKLEQLEREYGRLKPCPFCNHIPEVKHGCFHCKRCRLTMNIPFRRYKSVQDMVDQTWNRRVGCEPTKRD